MRATLLKPGFYLLFVFSAFGFAAGQNGAPKPTQSSAESKIQIENWTKPESGWLYVLDAKRDAGGAGGRVWLIDPESGKVMGSLRTGDNPDFALSPDGSRLYVASITERDSSELAVIDTLAGAIVQRSAVEDREVGAVIPAFSTMAVSGDGLALRIVRDTPKAQDADMFLLDTFDTQTGEFLPNSVRLYNCGPGRIIFHETAEEFDVLCPRSNRIRQIRVDAESHQLQNVNTKMPGERRIGVAVAFEPPAGGEIGIIRGDASVVVMNTETHEFAETAAHSILPNRIPPAAWPASPDGGRIYLGFNTGYDRHYDNRFYLDYGRPPNLRPENATADEFRVVDTQSWKKIGTIKTKMPFWSAAIANDGKTLYAMAPQKHSILVIDTEKMRETRVLQVGVAPTLAVVAP
jgi:DNA-binding beta-propeller fold protein YncE